MEAIKETVKRNMNNFSRVASWNTTMNKKEVEYLLSQYDNTIFCNGHLREIKFEAITPDFFKVYTVSF